MKHKAVEEYQCPGCVSGQTDECFEKCEGESLSCKNHVVGTICFPIVGSFALGMPNGFNRVGEQKRFLFEIYKTQEDKNKQSKYNIFNIPVWKYKNEVGHIFVRGYMPRLNKGFVQIILNGDYDSIDALEVDPKNMD